MATSCPGDAFPWDELLKRLEDKQLEPITIKIGDKVIAGQLDGDTTTGPVRAIAEAMGGAVAWDEATKTVTVIPGGYYAENQILRQKIKQAYGVLAPLAL
jgi:hypothetical protein